MRKFAAKNIRELTIYGEKESKSEYIRHILIYLDFMDQISDRRRDKVRI